TPSGCSSRSSCDRPDRHRLRPRVPRAGRPRDDRRAHWHAHRRAEAPPGGRRRDPLHPERRLPDAARAGVQLAMAWVAVGLIVSWLAGSSLQLAEGLRPRGSIGYRLLCLILEWSALALAAYVIWNEWVR